MSPWWTSVYFGVRIHAGDDYSQGKYQSKWKVGFKALLILQESRQRPAHVIFRSKTSCAAKAMIIVDGSITKARQSEKQYATTNALTKSTP